MNRFEIYKDIDNKYWLLSTHSYRYDTIKADKTFEAGFELRNDAFKWFESRQIPRVIDDPNGYYEIYV